LFLNELVTPYIFFHIIWKRGEVNPQGLFKGKQAIGNLESINIECHNSFQIYLDGDRQDSFYRFGVRNKTPTLWFHMKNSTEQAIYEFVKPRFEWRKNSHTRVSYTQGHKCANFYLDTFSLKHMVKLGLQERWS
jgi:hypothetical protein